MLPVLQLASWPHDVLSLGTRPAVIITRCPSNSQVLKTKLKLFSNLLCRYCAIVSLATENGAMPEWTRKAPEARLRTLDWWFQNQAPSFPLRFKPSPWAGPHCCGITGKCPNLALLVTCHMISALRSKCHSPSPLFYSALTWLIPPAT